MLKKLYLDFGWEGSVGRVGGCRAVAMLFGGAVAMLYC